MTTFAKLENNVVVDVIDASAQFVATLPGTWIETGAGVHKNYAGKGYGWNAELQCFFAPQPYPSWTLNSSTCQWEPPTAMPVNSNRYVWNENTQQWVIV